MVKQITLSDDTPHAIITEDIPFYSCDFQCQTNALKLGVGGAMGFVLNANETFWTYNANLRDFMIQNNTAGLNGTLVVIATVPNKYVSQSLKLGFTPR